MLDASELAAKGGVTRQSDVAFAVLKADLVACRIAPGVSVTEAELAQHYRLGKAAVRAALARLAERGWLSAQARRGYRVRPIALSDITEIFDLRRMIGPPAARIAAGRVDANRLAQLAAMLSAGFVPDDPASAATFLQTYRQFHLAIVRAGGNRRLVRTFEQLWDETERLIHHSGVMHMRPLELCRGHHGLAAALAAADGKAAAAAATDEIDRLYRAIVDTALRTASVLAPAEWSAKGSAPAATSPAAGAATEREPTQREGGGS